MVLEGRGNEPWEGGTLLQSVINISYKLSLSIPASSSVSSVGSGAGGEVVLLMDNSLGLVLPMVR